MDLIFKSIILSLIATASINMAYSINNPIILLGINVICLVMSYFVVIKIKSNEEEEYKKRERKMLGVITSHIKAVNQSVISSNTNIVDSILSIENNINSILMDNSSSIDNQLNNFIELFRNVIQESNMVIQENNRSMEKIISEDKNNSVSMMNAVESVNSILLNLKDTLELNNKELYIKLDILNEFLNSSKESVNEIIEMKHIIKSNASNVANIFEKVNENIDILMEQKEEVRRFKNEVNALIEENVDSNTELAEIYKEIQSTTLFEINKLAEKNEYVTSLLMDSYKVLNIIMNK